MRIRPSSRLIILSPQNHVLLFHFCHKNDALKGKSYWATSGEGLEQNESYEQAALRELFEETENEVLVRVSTVSLNCRDKVTPIIQGIGVDHRRALRDLVRAMDGIRLKPVIDKTFGLDELPQALE